MIPAIIALLAATQGYAADEIKVSPSIEADAEYLLTTEDFMDAQFGMAVEEVLPGPPLVVRTTGAVFTFFPAEDRLTVQQRLGEQREALEAVFTSGMLAGLRVTRQGTGGVLLSARDGELRLRINSDSLLMLCDSRPAQLSYRLGLKPASLRQRATDFLFLDEYGAVGSYIAAGEGGTATTGPDQVNYSLAAGQVLWLSVGPPRPYDWEASYNDRVVWHWSMETGYPSDQQIAQWSEHGNMLLQQAEVMLWKDWSLRFIPRNGVEEFQRVNDTCARHGMRNYVYTSPYYFLTGTGLEDRAMNSFDNFAVTGFSPGDGRGLNWPIFLDQIRHVMEQYKPDGLYFDGIYDNIVRTYLISRKAREVVGDQGILEYHATGSPPGGGVYLPQIDTYFNFILRGEGVQSMYGSDDYLRYFVSTYNISNSIGVLCNNNDFTLDEAFIDRLLDHNIRLHLIPGWLEDYRKQVVETLYFPALNEALRPRVEAACAARQEESRELWSSLETPDAMQDLDTVYAEDFESFPPVTKAPEPAADSLPVTQPPARTHQVPLEGGWTACFSPNSRGTLSGEGGALKIEALTNTCAYLERDLPDDAIAVQCKLRCMPGGGASWGPGLMVRCADQYWRMNARSDDRIGVDRAMGQALVDGYHNGIWYWVRIWLLDPWVVYEVSGDSTQWTRVQFDNARGQMSGPKQLILGKLSNGGTCLEYSELWGDGVSYIDELRVLRRR